MKSWIGDDGAHLRGYKHRCANQAQTKPEEQGPLKLTTLCPAGKLLQTKKISPILVLW